MLGLGIGIIYQGLTREVAAENNTTTNTKALHFDGDGDKLTIANQADLSFSGTGNDDDVPFSIAVWAKKEEAGVYTGLFYKGGVGGSSDYDLEYRVFWLSSNKIYFDISDGTTSENGYNRVASKLYNTGGTAWQHLVFTYSGVIGSAGMKIYVNGALIGVDGGGTDAEGMTPSSDDLILGNIDVTTTAYDFDGEMCQFVMWKNHELSLGEVQYLYGGGLVHRNPILEATSYSASAASSVVLWLPLDADLADASGNSYDGTAGGDAALSADTVPIS